MAAKKVFRVQIPFKVTEDVNAPDSLARWSQDTADFTVEAEDIGQVQRAVGIILCSIPVPHAVAPIAHLHRKDR